MLWAGTSPNSSGTIPAHRRVEKLHLTRKSVNEKINKTVEKRFILSLILQSIVGQPLNQLVGNSWLIWRGTNLSEK